ncbi:TPA: hypothetical protein RJR38_003806 [Burkholderia multivorans]|nr:hypothetical protein [Burkholderia multivorans]
MISIRDLPLRCPCCRSKTLRERGGFEICSVCFWQDDGQDDESLSESLCVRHKLMAKEPLYATQTQGRSDD